MELTWDLEVLYKGYEDPKYIEDSKKIIELINIAKEEKLDINNKVSSIEKHLEMELEISKLIRELFSYNNLRVSTNVNDYSALAEMGKLRLALQETVASNVAFTKFLKDVDLDALAKESEVIKNHLFVLKEEQSEALHMLSDSEEILASKLQLVGSSGWSQLQGNLTSNLVIDVLGYGNNLPLPSVRNMAYSNDANLRKVAYEAEINAYKRIEDAVAMALNNIKREVNIMMPLRHYESALEKTLEQSRMTSATLNAMIEAIKEEAPKFREYFKLKAKALGHENGLPFYDLFAPMGSMHKTYTIEEAKDLVLDVYGSFSKSLYDLGIEAFDNRWIDVYPCEKKTTGGFCCSMYKPHPYVLLNTVDDSRSIYVLAHELGHAMHGYLSAKVQPYQTYDHTIFLAEIASTVNEVLLFKYLYEKAKNKKEKLSHLERYLGNIFATIYRQTLYSEFEYYAHKLIENSEPISKELLNNKWKELTIKYYGKGVKLLKEDVGETWMRIPHFYRAYYVYKYATGMTSAINFATKIYSGDEDMKQKYLGFLKSGTNDYSTEILKNAGVDLEDESTYKLVFDEIKWALDEMEKLI
jgi:oligoendopeptidase F